MATDAFTSTVKLLLELPFKGRIVDIKKIPLKRIFGRCLALLVPLLIVIIMVVIEKPTGGSVIVC